MFVGNGSNPCPAIEHNSLSCNKLQKELQAVEMEGLAAFSAFSPSVPKHPIPAGKDIRTK
jgi:hypothetical protein